MYICCLYYLSPTCTPSTRPSPLRYPVLHTKKNTFFKQAYKPSFVRRQCRRFEFQRILLPVRMRIHWGMGRFWAIFFASVRFVRKVLCDGCGGGRGG